MQRRAFLTLCLTGLCAGVASADNPLPTHTFVFSIRTPKGVVKVVTYKAKTVLQATAKLRKHHPLATVLGVRAL